MAGVDGKNGKILRIELNRRDLQLKWGSRAFEFSL
jgi:hypothetical protein